MDYSLLCTLLPLCTIWGVHLTYQYMQLGLIPCIDLSNRVILVFQLWLSQTVRERKTTHPFTMGCFEQRRAQQQSQGQSVQEMNGMEINSPRVSSKLE